MNHVAVILAAGGSARLGRPKQLLAKDGEALVHRAVRLALATAPTRTLVVVGAQHDTVAAALADLPCDLVVNADRPSGLAGSLAVAGLALAAHTGPVLLLVCDQPRLQVEHLQALLRAATATGIAASRYDETVGVPAVVPADWLADGSARGDHGFGQRLRTSPATVCVDDDTLADDLDTPADVAAAIAAGWLDDDQSVVPVTTG